MIYFRLALLLHSLIISSLCNAMNERLPLVRSFSTEKNILGIGFPTNDTVLTIHEHGWATFCPKTEEPKINITNGKYIADGALSKDGKIAIVDLDNLTIHNIETGKIIYTKAMFGDLKRVAFCSNNNTLGVYNYAQDFIAIHTIEKNEEKEERYNIPYLYVKLSLFAGNPTNKEFIIGNKIVEYVKGDAIATSLPGHFSNMLSSSYNPDGTVIAIKCKDGYLFHRKGSQDFFINSDQSYEYAPYRSIAFHPKKQCAALLTEDNNIEFWDYTKKTEKPLAIIELPNKNKQTTNYHDLFSKLMGFAPDGENLAVIITGGNTFYIVPTPETAYYDDATKAQCVAFIWVIKNQPDLPFIPQDIVKLIMHKLSRIPDFQLPQQITQ
jgi:hypothetical protein